MPSPAPNAPAHAGTPAAAASSSSNSAGYANPLRAIRNLVPERIDQGVDYSGTGPVYALGPGRITYVGIGQGTGWAGAPEAGVNPGGYVGEQLTTGPAKGSYVYVAEGITPAPGLHVGQSVNASTIIARMSAAIETGFGSGAGTEARAAARGETGITTASGTSYSNLIRELGGRPGIPQNPVQQPGSIQTFKFLPAAKPSPAVVNTPGRALAQSHYSPGTPQLLLPARSSGGVVFPPPRRPRPAPRRRPPPRRPAAPHRTPVLARLVAYVRPAAPRPRPRTAAAYTPPHMERRAGF